jgi:MFS family permease
MSARAGPDGKLSPADRRKYVLLGLPTLGLSLAGTMVRAYMPVFARELTQSRFVIGALVGGEGIVSLLLPAWVGAASDRVHTRIGPRFPFILLTVPITALALLFVPFGRSIGVLAIDTFVFYTAYYTCYAPYRALYSDIVPLTHGGRAQGIEGLFRGAGLGGALVGGALLIPLWRPLPFFVASAALVATTLVALLGLRRELKHEPAGTTRQSPLSRIWVLIHDYRQIRWFLVANVFWQVTEGGLKSFIVLYLRRGLGWSFSAGAAGMAVVGVGAVLAAPLAGKLADRYGAVRVMEALLVVFGVGLWAPTFSKSLAVLIPILPVLGLGGAMVYSLPYAVLMRIMPQRGHGAAAGLFDVSGGLGALVGPVATGAAIDALTPLFPSTHGYAAMWPVIGIATLLSIAFLRVGRVGDPNDQKLPKAATP